MVLEVDGQIDGQPEVKGGGSTDFRSSNSYFTSIL